MTTQDDLKDFGVRLFLSVDIAGSTKFKGSFPSIKVDTRDSMEGNDGQEPTHNSWVPVYKEFFTDFPAIFAKALEVAAQDERHATQNLPSQLNLWKMLGDELIFVVQIKTEADAGAALLAFYEAIRSHQEEIQKKHANLSLKGTAWTAGFPIRNRRVVVDQPNGKQVEDFIGPDMDIGFRLSKVARPGPIIASMDLIDLLIGRSYQSKFNCAFVGWETMKGVFADKPYPVHWLVHKQNGLSLPPWEEAICQFAAGFSQWQANNENNEKLIERINETRTVLNRDEGLDLFPPYLDKSGMPHHHQGIHAWLERNERSELTSEADFGVDEAAATDPTVEN